MDLSTEIQNDLVTDTNPGANEVNTMFATIEPYLSLKLNEQLSIDASVIFESISPPADNDSFFDHEGVFLEEFKGVYTAGPFSFFGGKFNPSFGSAWDRGGIWDEDFAADYEITEQIGGGASYTVGDHTLTANAYFADTSYFSQSWITQRGRTREADGGLTNTGDFSSFSGTLAGSLAAMGYGDTTYNLGYRHHGIEGLGFDAENGYVAGIGHVFKPSEALSLDTLLEYVSLDNAGGVTNDETKYITANVHGTYMNNWLGGLSWTARNTNLAAGGETDDALITATVGYKLREDMVVEGGYRFTEESNLETSIWGLRFSYNTNFDFGFGSGLK